MDPWQYRQDLERLANYLCRHPEDAEDVAHNALVKAAAKLEGFRREASVKTWLHVIATNECRMLRRRKQPSSLDELFDRAAAADLPELRAEELDPGLIAEELETRAELLTALEQLPDKYRCALLLKEGRGLSLEEVAEHMETSVSAVKSLLYRARGRLRASVAQR